MRPSATPHPEPTAGDCARRLLESLGLQHLQPVDDGRTAGELWAVSGAMWLSGHRQGPPRACPAPLAACARGAGLALAALTGRAPDPDFDACRLLGERAAIAGLSRRGRVSPGGACRLLDTADGVIALNLARDSDRELLPAWVEQELTGEEALADLLRHRPLARMVERARLLGLAAAPQVRPPAQTTWFRAERHAAERPPPGRPPLVVDLSTLWAGPLCGQLLSMCGARVIKVESHGRPDGARYGPEPFYHLMNAGKESVALDLESGRGRSQLHQLLTRADIVIESARPRGLEQMGIRAADIIARNPGMVWLGITGYGRSHPARDWIAYGDDAGVAAGLSWLMGGDRGDPVFCGDAIADPLTGLHAAVLALAAWHNGGGQLLDVPLRDVAAWCIGAGTASAETIPPRAVSRPVARPVTARAADMGADTARVLKEFA